MLALKKRSGPTQTKLMSNWGPKGLVDTEIILGFAAGQKQVVSVKCTN